MKDIEKKVFETICKSEVNIMDRGYPIASTFIAEHLNITLYKARKALKTLKEKGLVKSCHCSIYSNLDERYGIASGYLLTELGKQTEEYKRAEQQEIELIKKIFGV